MTPIKRYNTAWFGAMEEQFSNTSTQVVCALGRETDGRIAIARIPEATPNEVATYLEAMAKKLREGAKEVYLPPDKGLIK